MAAVGLQDRVKETTATSGTGTLTLDGPMTGFQGFSSIGTGSTTYYTITDNAAGTWEVGVGVWTTGGPYGTLSRDTVLSSSNAGALVPFSTNIKEVFITYPANRAAYEDTSQLVYPGSGSAVAYLNTNIVTGNITIPTGYTAMSGGPITISNGATVTVENGSRWVIV